MSLNVLQELKKKAELCKLNFEESFKLKCWLLDEPLNHLDQNGILFLKKNYGQVHKNEWNNFTNIS